jgi:hypothetical protein
MNEYGTNWQFRTNNGKKLIIIGKCIRTGYDVDSGGEYWYSEYLPGYTDFGGPEALKASKGSLHECVQWIEHYVYGGYFINFDEKGSKIDSKAIYVKHVP